MYVGIDIGGTNIRIAKSESLDKPIIKAKQLFTPSKDLESSISDISQAIEQLGENIEAIGIGTTGTINDEGTAIISTSKFPNWVNKPITEILSKRFNCPVFMENDAVVAALGEAYFGLRENHDFLYLTWGTGLGGALVKMDKDVVVSRVSWSTSLSKWEALLGGREINTRFGKPAEQLTENDWENVMSDFRNAVTSLSTSLNQELIIIGGGITIKQKERILSVAKKLTSPKILISTLGEDTGLHGAFALIKNSI